MSYYSVPSSKYHLIRLCHLFDVDYQFLFCIIQVLYFFLKLPNCFLDHSLIFTNDILERLLFTKYRTHFFCGKQYGNRSGFRKPRFFSVTVVMIVFYLFVIRVPLGLLEAVNLLTSLIISSLYVKKFTYTLRLRVKKKDFFA